MQSLISQIEKNTLILDSQMPLQDAFRASLARKGSDLSEPFVVKHTNNTYKIIDMHTLLMGQLDLMTNLYEEIHTLSVMDPLTKVNNRRGFFNLAQSALDNAYSAGNDLSVLMIDIDDFKLVNDCYGHLAGDLVIKSIAESCQKVLRKSDLLGRYGGEEFILFLPDTPVEYALSIAERIRLFVEDLATSYNGAVIKVTISLGISHLRFCDGSLDNLILQADQALYLAKNSGKNRVVIWRPEIHMQSNPGNSHTPNNSSHGKKKVTKAKNSSQRYDLSKVFNETIEGWARALELRDKETKGHAQRVTYLTLRLAQKIGINEGIAQIRWGALLHDIGKIAIPDNILLKPGKLTEEEWTIMRKHPIYAYELLSPIEYLQSSLDIPYYHHERWDGKGYPCALAGDNIPLPARIFSIVDVWDALSSDRCYRPAWPFKKVREYLIQESGLAFDPMIVQPFLDLLDEENLIQNSFEVEPDSVFNPLRKKRASSLQSFL